jgi:hypothetical protein
LEVVWREKKDHESRRVDYRWALFFPIVRAANRFFVEKDARARSEKLFKFRAVFQPFDKLGDKTVFIIFMRVTDEIVVVIVHDRLFGGVGLRAALGICFLPSALIEPEGPASLKPVETVALEDAKRRPNDSLVKEQRFCDLSRLPAFAEQNDGFNSVGGGSIMSLLMSLSQQGDLFGLKFVRSHRSVPKEELEWLLTWFQDDA